MGKLQKICRMNRAPFFVKALILCGLMLFTLPFHSAIAQQAQPLILTAQEPVVHLNKSLKLFDNVAEDKNFIDLVSRYRRAEGRTPPDGAITLRSAENIHWLVFSVFNQDRFNQQWLLYLGDLFDGTLGHVNRIEVYEIDQGNSPYLIDGRRTFNKTQPQAQRKNVIPLNVSVSELKIFGIKIITSPGPNVAFEPQILTHGGYKDLLSQDNRHDFTILLILTFLLIVCLVSALASKKLYTYLLLPYVILHACIVFSRDEIVSFGNNTLVFLTPAITYGLLSFFVFFSALIGLDERYRKIKQLAGALFIASILFGLYISFATNLGSAIETVLLFWMPYLWLSAGLIMAGFIFVSQENKAPGYSLLASALFLAASHLLSAWMMTEVTYAAQLFGVMLIGHLAFFIAYTHMTLMKQARAERLAEEAESQKAEKALRQKEQIKASDQEKLVNILQRERELLAELKEREAERAQAMRHAKMVADEANRAKSAFLAVISHEIRTPMTGIMGMIRLLLDSNLGQEQKEYAETIQYSGDALLALLNDILDFSKIEEGRMEIETVSFDIRKMIDSVVMLMSGRAKERKIDLSANVTERTPQYLKGDPTRLRQVLLNLIGNAIKFTEQGGVTLNIDAQNGQNDDFNIYFGVQDTGIGISEEAQKNLFNPFSQADSSISRRFGGTGLGLAICKRLVTAMGGEIQIQSAQGKGSLFHFTLPMDQGYEAATTFDETANMPTGQFRILVADDNEINQKVLIGLLSKDDHDVHAVSNGQEALDKVKAEKFDLVLMDMEMPVMDGIEATRAIRGLQDSEKCRTPIVAMTANVIKEDIERCKQAGMNEYISKPIDPNKLRAVIGAAVLGEGAFKPVRRATDTVRSDIDPNIHSNAADTSPAPDLFDKEMLGGLKDSLGVEVLDEMMQDLYAKADELIEEIEKAFSEQNYTDLRARAHDLKGMTSNFGLTGISELAAPIESGAREEKPLSDLEKSVTKLRPVYKSLRSSLKDWFKE